MLWPILKSALTALLVVGAFGFMLTRLARIAALINSGRHQETLTDTPGRRLRAVLSMVFGHRKVLEDRWSGLLHIVFLYGFLTLAIGHIEIVLEGLTWFLKAFGREPLLYERLPFVPAAVIPLYRLSQDVLAALVMLAAAVALGRRWSGRVTRLMPSRLAAEAILYFILGLYLTFFLLFGSGLVLRAGGAPGFSPWQPVSSFVAGLLAGLPVTALAALNESAWWAHVLVFLSFGCYIPLSKHMHLVFAGPNVYFFRKQGMGLPPAIDFEKSEKFGIDRVQELPWKTLLDSFACTECGRCNVVCPAHLTGKPLLPMKVLHDIKANLRYGNGDQIMGFRDRWGRPLAGKAEAEAAATPALSLLRKEPVDRSSVGADGSYQQGEGQIHLDEAWACTTCAACVEVCPVSIDSVPGSLIGLRQGLVLMESEFPKEMAGAFKGMEVQGNPWGVGHDKREEWARGLDVAVLSEIAAQTPGREVEYLFWVGCAGATDPRAQKVQQALVAVLKAAGVDFAILGREERCTGDPARRMGNEYLFNTLAQENIATLGKYRFKQILTTCPHCYNSLKNDYAELGVHYSVRHHSDLLSELLAAGRVPMVARSSADSLVTFHDPCYLGRYNDGCEPPRRLLGSIGAPSREMERSGKQSFCCGAGGGRMFMEESIGKRVNLERTDQALATGAKTIAVGCPFCLTMLTDGTKARQVDQEVAVKDLAELVAERLPPGQPPAPKPGA